MLLFATELDAAGQTLALGGWIGGALSVLVTVVNAVISARAARDRLQFDAERQRMAWRIETLELTAKAAEAECQRRLDVVQAQVNVLQTELLAERVKTRLLQEQLDHEIARRRQHVRNLSTRVDGLDPSKSNHGQHPPADPDYTDDEIETTTP